MNDEDKTVDDVLEEERNNNGNVNDNKLPQDNEPPAAPADRANDATDPGGDLFTDRRDNLDDGEVYDEGTVDDPFDKKLNEGSPLSYDDSTENDNNESKEEVNE